MAVRNAHGDPFNPLDERDQSTVRAAIYARSSETSAQAEDMEEQVIQCRDFIKTMGWPPVPDVRIFRESKSGVRNVERPKIDAVLALAAEGKIDVVVCREWERVARVAARRHQIIMTAEDFGVEFRFANLAATRGKMPDTLEYRLTRAVLEELGQIERDKLVERLTPPRWRRYTDGLPHGGGGDSLLYGYLPATWRIGRHGKKAGTLTWKVDEERAEWVRWLFDRVDALDAADLSRRDLARELTRRGAPTPSSTPEWNPMAVKRILTNPKYCGRGRNLRWSSTHVPRKLESGKVREKRILHDRLHDEEAWKEQTVKIKDGAIPPIITPEQFDRVQAKLNDPDGRTNRGGPRRTDLLANSTLLDGHFVRCAECGNKMARYWHQRDARPHYACTKDANFPTYGHQNHHIPAPETDALALDLLAKVLTDPEKILELATAAEAQLKAATTDVALAEGALATYRKRIKDIEQQQESLRTARAALSNVPGMDQQIADIDAQLEKLRAEAAEAEAERDGTLPSREQAVERVAFLRSLFTERDYLFDFTKFRTGIPSGPIQPGEPTRLRLGWTDPQTGNRVLPVSQAAALLGVAEDELDLPIQRGESIIITNDDGSEEVDADADTVDLTAVIHYLLKRASRDQVRKLLRALDAVVVVSRPRSREERKAHGNTPIAERVTLQLLGTVVIGSVGTYPVNSVYPSPVTVAPFTCPVIQTAPSQ